jgi:hypothetical protein
VAQRGAVPARLRYTPALRAQAVAYAMERKGTGAGHALIAEELAVARPTLSAWLVAAKRLPAFRTVEVADLPRDARSLVVHSPGGLRIEGLDLAGLAELIRRLG